MRGTRLAATFARPSVKSDPEPFSHCRFHDNNSPSTNSPQLKQHLPSPTSPKSSNTLEHRSSLGVATFSLSELTEAK